MHELNSYLDVPLSYAGSSLVSDAARARVLDRVNGLPVALCSGYFGFETHLSDVSDRTDAAFCLCSREGNKDAIFAIRQPDTVGGFEAGERGMDFLSRSIDQPDGFWNNIDYLWLTFDVSDDPAARWNYPGLYFRPIARDTQEGYLEQVLSTVCQAMDEFMWDGAASATGREVRRVIGLLDEPDSLAFVGWMWGRSARTVKVNMVKPDIAGALDLVKRVGCEMPIGIASRYLAAYEPPDKVGVQFEVGEEVAPRVGIELVYRSSKDTLLRFCDTLVTQGLAVSAKANPLGAYLGIHEISVARWPVLLAGGTDYALNNSRLCFRRTVSHVKINFEPGKEPIAKAYFGGYFLWFDPVAGQFTNLSGQPVGRGPVEQ
jgi:hypothetical protein